MAEPVEKTKVPEGATEPIGANEEFVKKYLAENKDTPFVKEVLSEVAPVNKDVVSSWAETEEGTKFFQAFADKRVTQALKTFEEGHFKEKLDAAVEAEVRKRNPNITEEQKRLSKIETLLEEEQAKRKRAEMKSVTVEYANHKGLNMGDLLDRFVGSNEETIRMDLDKMEDWVKLREQQAVNKVLAGSSRVPSGGDKQEEVMFSSMEEIARFLKDNPEKYIANKEAIDRSIVSLNKKR